MAKTINKVKEIDVAAVEGNKTLAAAVDRRAVERCKEAIEKLGVVHTPIVGVAKNGNRLLLSGQCGLTALRELGVKKMGAIEVDATSGAGSRAKLSLLLLSLQEKPGALCEGLLLQEAVGAGVPRPEIQAMLGKSASWVSNRLALAVRLDANVYEMVRSGLLEPRSAVEVARLPQAAQFAFAETAVREGLPKSAVELLVAGYNDKDCPDAVKAQMLKEPRDALKRMADRRQTAKAGRAGRRNAVSPLGFIDEAVKSLKLQMAALRQAFSAMSPQEAGAHMNAIKELELNLSETLETIQGIVSLGKRGCGHGAR